MSFATRLLTCAVLAWAMALVGARDSHAVDIYSVSGIEVDVSAESAVDAQVEAVALARREGLQTLMRRLTTREYFSRLPSIAEVDAAVAAKSHEVEREQVAATRYVASILVSYDGEAVQRLMRPSGAPIVLAASEPLLVLPAIELEDGRLDIWGDDNPWRRAWALEAERNTLLDIRLPLGDLSDVATFSVALSPGERGTALGALAERYQVGAALLVIARAPSAAGEGATELELRQDVTLGWSWNFAGGRVSRTNASDALSLWQAGARRVMSEIELAWKADHLVRFGETASLAFTVPLVDLRNWVQIRHSLQGIPEVQSLTIDAFSQSEASVRLAFVGGRAQLERALEARGLALEEGTNGWLLRRAAGIRGDLQR